MATGKKFYWLKLKVDFLNSEVIDYILSQKNGSDYLAIYLILCTKTINTKGELVNQLGEVIIPYDTEKIQRDCKHFHIDTIRVAMELFSKLNLIYMQENGILKISNYDELVGYETDYALKMAKYRKEKNEKIGYNVTDNVGMNVRQEIRDKRLDIRDIDIRDINTTTTTDNIIDFWNNNFHLITPFEIEKIENWLLSFDEKMILLALEECVKQNKRTFSYFNGILKNWKTSGYKIPSDIKSKENKKEESWKKALEDTFKEIEMEKKCK